MKHWVQSLKKRISELWSNRQNGEQNDKRNDQISEQNGPASFGSKHASVRHSEHWGFEPEQLLKDIDRARKEWHIARQKFDAVSDPDQVDYAIYAMEAAEKRYVMLIRQAKKHELSVDFHP